MRFISHLKYVEQIQCLVDKIEPKPVILRERIVVFRLAAMLMEPNFVIHPNPMSMNRIFQPSAEAILFRLSDAAERYRGDKGQYKVTYRKKLSKVFPTLLEAFLFYITLDEEADLYDVTNDSILIERKIQLFLN